MKASQPAASIFAGKDEKKDKKGSRTDESTVERIARLEAEIEAERKEEEAAVKEVRLLLLPTRKSVIPGS